MRQVVDVQDGKIVAPHISITRRWPLICVIGHVLFYYDGDRFVLARLDSVAILLDPKRIAHNAGRVLTVRRAKV